MTKFLIVACAVTIAITSCNKQKQGVNPSNQTATTVAQAGTNFSKTKPPKNPPNAHMQGGTSAGWCSSPSFNCKYLKTVTVSALTVLNGLNTASPGEVAYAFNNNPALVYINENMSDDYLTKLVSGSYYIHTCMTNDSDASYIVGRTSPVTLENFEFALHYSTNP